MEGVVLADKAWDAQSKSLIEVQKKGSHLEKLVRGMLGWSSGRIVYEHDLGYKVQVDCAYPSLANPEVIASVTYTSPDKPGHSNENKLHLKVGELALLKRAYPEVKIILVLGGVKESWLPYVLDAFEYFYDEVICLWDEKGFDRIRELASEPSKAKFKNKEFWASHRDELNSIQLFDDNYNIPCGLVRYAVLDLLKQQEPIVHNPTLIENPVAGICMQKSYENQGAEWQNYLEGNWHNIEMSRNYFNPVEATVELSLREFSFEFEGGIARDVPVPSLLHSLGMPNTRVSEDFTLYSETLDMEVYIQCKASGGGRGQHGKNIQNRTKEQITRCIIYRGEFDDGNLIWGTKKFHWIGVLDGDWGVTKSEPFKYVHMLQLAGYDKLFCAADLLTPELIIRKENNPLVDYLIDDLNCKIIN
jgi:hypothetical protein